VLSELKPDNATFFALDRVRHELAEPLNVIPSGAPSATKGISCRRGFSVNPLPVESSPAVCDVAVLGEIPPLAGARRGMTIKPFTLTSVSFRNDAPSEGAWRWR